MRMTTHVTWFFIYNIFTYIKFPSIVNIHGSKDKSYTVNTRAVLDHTLSSNLPSLNFQVRKSKLGVLCVEKLP